MSSGSDWHRSLLTKLQAGFAPRPAGREAPRPRSRRIAASGTGSGSYAAVVIRAPRCACAQARRLAGVRLLRDDAPALPLPSCSVRRCACVYESYPDRREETRRAVDVGISGSFFVGPQRRCGLDRRISDRGGSDRSYFDFRREHGLRRTRG